MNHYGKFSQKESMQKPYEKGGTVGERCNMRIIKNYNDFNILEST
jgi:hypothetical protein